MFALLALVALAIVQLASADSFFFNNTNLTAKYPNLSGPCVTSLNAQLSCDPQVQTLMLQDAYGPLGNETVQDILCRASCGTDLTNYISSVSSSCANDAEILPGRPLTWWGDSAYAAWNQFCLKDSATGSYCVDVVGSFFNDTAPDDDGTSLSTDKLCSNCVVNLFRHMQGTPFSNYDENLAAIWTTIQSKCNIQYPTDVQPLTTNVTTPGGFALPGSTYQGCLSGKTYNVVSGDNCEKIAEAQSVALGTLRTLNSLYDDCRNLWAGMVSKQ